MGITMASCCVPECHSGNYIKQPGTKHTEEKLVVKNVSPATTCHVPSCAPASCAVCREREREGRAHLFSGGSRAPLVGVRTETKDEDKWAHATRNVRHVFVVVFSGPLALARVFGRMMIVGGLGNGGKSISSFHSGEA